MSPLLKELSSGPPKPAESVPERMDGEFIGIDRRTKLVIRASRGAQIPREARWYRRSWYTCIYRCVCHWKVCPGWNRLNPLKTKKSVLKSNQENHKLLVLRDLVAEKHIVYGKVSLVLFRKSSSQILKSTGPRPTWSHWDCSFTRVSRAGVEQTRPPQHYGPGEPPQAKMALISQSRSGRRSLRIYIVFHHADWRVDVQSLMIEFVVSLSNDAPTYESND